MQTILDLGADVDSRFIVIATEGDVLPLQRIANERAAIAAWLRQIPRGSRLGVEATGSYHEPLVALAHRAGLQVFVVNGRDLRDYAKGVGRRAKTDRVDAEVMARYVAREHAELHAHIPPTKPQRAVMRLFKRRSKLVAIRGALNQSLRGLPSLRASSTKLNDQLEQLIGEIDILMQKALAKVPKADKASQKIATIPGFGRLGSTCLGATFTRIPFANSDAAIAHTGLDPRPVDSGAKRGRRRLSKRGPSEHRRVLFNCAMSAARTKLWKPYYLAQRAKGLSSTAAIVILARKMVRVAFALYKRNQVFDPTLIAKST